MDTLLNAALSNAVAATLLAVVAAVVGWLWPRPAVRHALWLLVLLKLVTPPLVDIPLPWPTVPETIAEYEEEESLILHVDSEELAARELALAEVLGEEEAAVLPAATAEPLATETGSWRSLLLLVWVGGSVLWLGRLLVTSYRFARLVRHTRRAPAWLQEEANLLARRLGLAESPPVMLIPGRVSPMLWAVGGAPQLLVPGRLLERLDPQGRQALLAHELAHLLRRDHWVRLLETLTTAFYWWHPVVWWTRRALRDAEEECCDAWAVWVQPNAARSYALTLVETVDFLSESQAPLPMLASGLGHGDDLKRRLTMIMQGSTPRTLGWQGLLSVLTLGAFLLPIVPVWGQEKKEEKKKEERRVIVVTDGKEVKPIILGEEAKKEVKEGVIRFVKPGDDLKLSTRVIEVVGDSKDANEDIAKLKAELEKKRAELKALEARLAAAAARLQAQAIKQAKVKEVEAKATATKTDKGIRIIVREGDKERVIEVPANAGADAIKEALRKAESFKGTLKVEPKKVEPKVTPPLTDKKEQPLGLRVRRVQEEGDQAARLAELEKRIKALMEEVEKLRMGARKGTAPLAPVPPVPPKAPIPPDSIR